MCIICFLTDLNQYNLRKSAQYRSDRFEHSLKLYKESFIVNFEKSLLEPLCSSHNTKKNTEIKTYLEDVDIDNIKQIFDVLKNVYFFWIDGKTNKSIKELKGLLKLHNINSNIKDIHNHIFFRGRISKNFISHWDMFHIPFNKRFIISNQRYSLVGQPLLYLAKSPICVINELEEIENLRISTFRFKSRNKMRIFDNTNKFSSIIDNSEIKEDINKNVDAIIDYKDTKFDFETIRMYLFHLIISGCCSFEKRSELKDYGFCEEYVLPQILAQVLKDNKFDGILYSSTKAPYKFRHITNTVAYEMFSHNLALFTKYNKNKIDDETYVYDKSLYCNFKISNPILFKDNLYLQQYYDKKLINNLMDSKVWGCLNEHDKEIIVRISDVIVGYLDLKPESDQQDEDKDIDKDIDNAISLHLFMLQNIILNIRDSCICNKIKEGLK